LSIIRYSTNWKIQHFQNWFCYHPQVRFDVFEAVVMRSSIFRDITPYSPVTVKWHLREICCFHPQDWRVSQTRNQHEASSKQSQPWRWRWHVPLKHWLTFTSLHAIISQKLELFYMHVANYLSDAFPIHYFIMTTSIAIQYCSRIWSRRIWYTLNWMSCISPLHTLKTLICYASIYIPYRIMQKFSHRLAKIRSTSIQIKRNIQPCDRTKIWNTVMVSCKLQIT
jgi:hypothetical protein